LFAKCVWRSTLVNVTTYCQTTARFYDLDGWQGQGLRMGCNASCTGEEQVWPRLACMRTASEGRPQRAPYSSSVAGPAVKATGVHR